mgnify:CR=1 FL=1
MANTAPSPLVTVFIALAHRAGREIMSHYREDVAVSYKADASPVTAADEAGEAIILKGLADAFPDIPVVSEEAASQGRTPEVAGRFILVDPLDGTKEFVNHNGEFTVNIALIENGDPAAGVVYAPAIERMVRGEAGQGAADARLGVDDDPETAQWRPLKTRGHPDGEMIVVASRSHRDTRTEAYLEALPDHRVVSAGSSLKFCLVAAGEADLYPRLGRTMEWDTAAGHAVLAAAGGAVVTEEDTPLTYGKSENDFANPHFIARGWT